MSPFQPRLIRQYFAAWRSRSCHKILLPTMDTGALRALQFLAAGRRVAADDHDDASCRRSSSISTGCAGIASRRTAHARRCSRRVARWPWPKWSIHRRWSTTSRGKMFRRSRRGRCTTTASISVKVAATRPSRSRCTASGDGQDVARFRHVRERRRKSRSLALTIRDAAGLPLWTSAAQTTQSIFRGADEIVLVQAADGVRLEPDAAVAPAALDVRDGGLRCWRCAPPR